MDIVKALCKICQENELKFFDAKIRFSFNEKDDVLGNHKNVFKEDELKSYVDSKP